MKDIMAGVNHLANLAMKRRGATIQTTSAVQIIVDTFSDSGRVWNDLKDGDITAEDIADGLKTAGDVGMLYGATNAPGAAEAGSIGAFTNALATQGKRIWRIFSGDDDTKKRRK